MNPTWNYSNSVASLYTAITNFDYFDVKILYCEEERNLISQSNIR